MLLRLFPSLVYSMFLNHTSTSLPPPSALPVISCHHLLCFSSPPPPLFHSSLLLPHSSFPKSFVLIFLFLSSSSYALFSSPPFLPFSPPSLFSLCPLICPSPLFPLLLILSVHYPSFIYSPVFPSWWSDKISLQTSEWTGDSLADWAEHPQVSSWWEEKCLGSRNTEWSLCWIKLCRTWLTFKHPSEIDWGGLSL